MQENVKELVEEIKNMSELMLDLAYSSVLFESKDIAKEVKLLHEKLEEMEEKTYLHLFAASRGKQAKKMISVIDIVESAKWVAFAAKNLSNMVIEGSALHPVIKEALKESDESITKAIITRNSILCNKTIGELRLRTEMGLSILAIRRGERWIFDPKKQTDMKEGDILICVGPSYSCEKLRKIAIGKVKSI
jgi:uncharacterized protein with PhoU and TrkA domain